MPNLEPDVYTTLNQAILEVQEIGEILDYLKGNAIEHL